MMGLLEEKWRICHVAKFTHNNQYTIYMNNKSNFMSIAFMCLKDSVECRNKNVDHVFCYKLARILG